MITKTKIKPKKHWAFIGEISPNQEVSWLLASYLLKHVPQSLQVYFIKLLINKI